MLILYSLAHSVWAADDLVSSQLVDDARVWQKKGRSDLAADLWRRVLITAPGHPEALLGLGLIEARTGNLQQAEALYNRARRLAKPPAGLNELATVLQSIKNPQVLANDEPPRRPADEPKATSTSTKVAPDPAPEKPTQSWEGTRTNLEQRARDSPNNAVDLLALARHLTQREGTRREAIRQLAALSERGLGNSESQSSWRSALKSLKVKNTDLAFFSAYLARFPDDADIKARLQILTEEEPAVALKKVELSNKESADILASTKMEADNKEKANALLKAALVDEQAASADAAATKLEEAKSLDPNNPWIRLVLARQYQQMGVLGGADKILDTLLETNPGMPQALHARALLFATQSRWLEALAMLEKIPRAARTAAMTQDQRLLWGSLQVQRAKQLFQQGELRQANALLTLTQERAGNDGALLATIATGWLDMAQPDKALRLMRDVNATSPPGAIDVHLQYATVLLNTYQDAELSRLLRDLAVPGRLNPAQQEKINSIILTYTVRLAEAMRESGRNADAAALLEPVLQKTNDTRAMLAMARIYRAAGNPFAALQFVERAILIEPNDVGHQLFAAELALAANSLDAATGYISTALTMAPDYPRALAIAGKIEKVRGNNDKALAFFQRAQAMEFNASVFVGMPGFLALRLLDKNVLPPKAPIYGSGASKNGNLELLPIPNTRRGFDQTPAIVIPFLQSDPARPALNTLPTPAKVIVKPATLLSSGTKRTLLIDAFEIAEQQVLHALRQRPLPTPTTELTAQTTCQVTPARDLLLQKFSHRTDAAMHVTDRTILKNQYLPLKLSTGIKPYDQHPAHRNLT